MYPWSGGGGSLLSGCEAPAPVRVSETGRARNWTMPPLRLERECKERTNSATIDNRCVEFDRRENQRCAFTMAEILLSLTIIGVVAAITLPSLTGNINERTWNTQRKALYARFSQAIALMPSLNGYGTLTEESSSGAGDAVDTAADGEGTLNDTYPDTPSLFHLFQNNLNMKNSSEITNYAVMPASIAAKSVLYSKKSNQTADTTDDSDDTGS